MVRREVGDRDGCPPPVFQCHMLLFHASEIASPPPTWLVIEGLAEVGCGDYCYGEEAQFHTYTPAGRGVA